MQRFDSGNLFPFFFQLVLLAKNKDNDFFSINFLKNNIGFVFQLIVVRVT